METQISLVGPEGEKSFGLTQAEAILRLQQKLTWDDFKLPDNSDYEFIDGSLQRRRIEAAKGAAATV